MTRIAWDLIGWDDGLIRIKGGRATYEAVSYDCSRGGRLVRLERLVPTAAGIRIVRRYVHPDTEMEPAEELARSNWTRDIDTGVEV